MIHPNDSVENKKVEKSLQDLNNEYAHALAQIGDRHYRQVKVENELEQLYKLVDSLMAQASTLQEKQKNEQIKEVPANENSAPV